MFNNNVWEGKLERAEKAKKWATDMDRKYFAEIQDIVKNSIIYHDSNDIIKLLDDKTVLNRILSDNIDSMTGLSNISLLNTDTVSAIKMAKNNKDNVVAALNFASFKYPGGKFLKGSKAQEECLCHESVLYNVLHRFDDTYYKVNRNTPNFCNFDIYTDNMIYCKDVIFEGIKPVKCDVITCAAPNLKSYKLFSNLRPYDDNDIQRIIERRIQRIIISGLLNGVNTFILGAWGCGVFGNSPKIISFYFHKTINDLENIYGIKRNYLFAIPGDDDNFKAFERQLFGNGVPLE